MSLPIVFAYFTQAYPIRLVYDNIVGPYFIAPIGFSVIESILFLPRSLFDFNHVIGVISRYYSNVALLNPLLTPGLRKHFQQNRGLQILLIVLLLNLSLIHI